MSIKECLIKPQITEKTSSNLGLNKYTFYVISDANKIEIRKYIEKKYSVNVVKVNVVNTKPKKRRRGRIVGKTSAKRKAIVTLKEGQEINAIKALF